MKVFGTLGLLFCFFIGALQAQENQPLKEISVSPNVLGTAQWAGFKYEEQLELAKKGNQKAVSALLDFSGTVDGVDALDHTVTCLELIPHCSDLIFAAALNQAKPKLKKVLLDRMQLAQGRTKNEALKKPILEWAPITWEVLNGKPFAPKSKNPDECLSSGSEGNMNSNPELEKTKKKAEMEKANNSNAFELQQTPKKEKQ